MADAVALGEIQYINPLLIDGGEVSLRPPELKSEQFLGLRKSIKQIGIQENITAYPNPAQKGKYIVINGLQRLTIAKELALPIIPVKMYPETITPLEVLSLQIQSNYHRVDTRPAAYGKQLRRFMMEKPSMTVEQIADDLGVSKSWVYARINLQSLTDEVAAMVDDGEIKASKAFWLAKLPQSEQATWVKMAKEKDTGDFIKRVSARLKEIQAAAKTGEVAVAEFQVIPRTRKGTEIKAEFENHSARARLVTEKMNAVTAFDLAIAWTLKVDEETVKADREQWDADQKAKDARKQERAQQRLDEKEKKLAEQAADAEKARKALEEL